jgi:hypothetical protein
MVNYFRARTRQTLKKNITTGLCQLRYLNAHAVGLNNIN